MNYAPHHPMADRRVAPPATRALGHWSFVIGHSPRGMTLVELLIVIVILATLTAAALPLMTPSTTERRIREASREVNAYIAQAQAKAQRAQRPYGVALKRLSSDTGNAEARGVCIEIVEVEQPVPYAGFDENSRIMVALPAATPAPGNEHVGLKFVTRGAPTTGGLPPGWAPDLFPPKLLRIGDVVEVQGSRYRVVRNGTVGLPNPLMSGNANADTTQLEGLESSNPSQATFLVARVLNDSGQVIQPVYDDQGRSHDPNTGLALSAGWLEQWVRMSKSLPAANVQEPQRPYWTEPAKYKIYRQPVTTSAPVLQLPNGAAIDLEASGIMGQAPFHLGGLTPFDTPIYIMFSAEGSIERVQYLRPAIDGSLLTGPISPTNNVALLIGRRENIPANTTLNLTTGTETEREAEKAKINWLDLESRWVTIGAQTGSVVTTENAFVSLPIPAGDYDNDGDQDGTQLETRMGQIQGAQEFARGMSRTGGG